ncbi:membrane protein [Mycobacterium holsaticum DSM 44478]|nr:membrane protein [Mycolicibacterium holsaticum DSM 44478 = JCM 12374]
MQLLVPVLWLGMVLAISFLEAPLKFGAPGVTLPIGLGIGRRVFKALNGVEIVLAVVLLVAILIAKPSTVVWILVLVAAAVLAIQVIFVRPPLTKRSNRVLAGERLPRSNMHYVYVAFELVKVGVLIALALVLTSRVVEYLV